MKESDLLNLRKIDSDLEGHPTPVSEDPENRNNIMEKSLFISGLNEFPLVSQKLQFVDMATGSLGQGLGAACGMAYTGKHFDKSR